ncbi:MAG: class I SAM-dependent methyltransferase, partial [Nanoarchaeota archaeon]|nr:class I SAM-dependent methyltransferase [Nanoarchaeota archaeon]
MKKLYRKIFPNYEIELEKAVRDCKSLLDIGCGSSSPIKHFSKNIYCEGIEIFEPDLKKSEEAKIHNKYYQISVLQIRDKFKENSFDCVLAS